MMRKFNSAFLFSNYHFQMKNVLAIIISFFFLFSISCKQAEKKDLNVTVIQGKISSPIAPNIYLFAFADSISQLLGEKTILDSCEIDKDGNYLFSLNWKQSSLFDLKNGNDLLIANLFLNPKDNITLNFTGEERKPKIVLNTKEAKYNDFLLQFKEKYFEEKETKHYYYVESNYLSILQFQNYIDKRSSEQVDFFHNYFKNETLSETFTKFVLTEIYYQSANDKMMFLWKKRIKEEWHPGDSVYADFLKETKIESPDALLSPAYHRFLQLYIDELYQQIFDRHKIVQTKPENISPNLLKFQTANEHLHGIYLELVCVKLLRDERNSVSTKNETHTATLDTLLHSLSASFKERLHQ